MFTRSLLKSKLMTAAPRNLLQRSMRPFGAMDQLNMDLFEHKFTSDMEFRSSFEKIKCFRVMD